MTLAALMDECRTATPDKSAAHRRWADLYPAYEMLRERGFSSEDAVKFLAQKGFVKKEEHKKAVNAFQVLACRRRQKAKA